MEKSRKSRNSGDRDRDLRIPKKSRKKNPENPKIPRIGIEIFKPLKNFEKISSAKSRKSRNPGDFFFVGLGIPKKAASDHCITPNNLVFEYIDRMKYFIQNSFVSEFIFYLRSGETLYLL